MYSRYECRLAKRTNQNIFPWHICTTSHLTCNNNCKCWETLEITQQYIIESFLPHVLIAEVSVGAPVERPPFDTAEATDGVEEAGVEAAAVEETDDDVNRSPDSISIREKIKVCLLWQEMKSQGDYRSICAACASGSALDSWVVPTRPSHGRHITW